MTPAQVEIERAAIKAAHPTRTGRHKQYAEAMRLVSERHEKAELVELVNWLLYCVDFTQGQAPPLDLLAPGVAQEKKT